jgi:hypothetical protein
MALRVTSPMMIITVSASRKVGRLRVVVSLDGAKFKLSKEPANTGREGLSIATTSRSANAAWHGLCIGLR